MGFCDGCSLVGIPVANKKLVAAALEPGKFMDKMLVAPVKKPGWFMDKMLVAPVNMS